MERWKAKWIMFEQCPENVTPVFRRLFCLEDTFERAEIRICGLGFYLLEVNGRRVGEELLQPAFTKYDKTVMYNTYNISDYLNNGENEIKITLGNGWFHEPGQDCFDFEHAVWKNKLQMICELYLDGCLRVCSDSKWQCREGKWSYNSVRFGENYNAGVREGEWRQAVVAKGPGGALKEQRLPGIRLQRYCGPEAARAGVYDFGRNLSGDVEITIEGKRGGTAEIIYGERLDANGQIDQTLIKRHPEIPRNQRDYYTKGTDGPETWHPEFSYKGFRYVQIKGNITVKKIRARVFYTDFEEKGGFWCSQPVLQQIYDASLWSVRTNFHHIPTDCPHREKNGWTGDAHMSAEFALLNLDMEEAYLQYLDNLCDCQWPDGQLPCIAPTSVYGYNYQSGPTWDAALIFIPWNLYLFTGKKEILKRYYEAMKRYMRYTQEISEDGICDSGLGDFLPDDGQEVCPRAMALTCFVLRMAEIMEKIAYIIGAQTEGKEDDEGIGEDALEWKELAADTKKAVIEKFYGKCAKTESYLSVVLYFGLSKQPEREAGELAELVRAKRHCAGGGIFGSIYTLETLTEYGYFEDALQIAMQPECPGWAFMLKGGGNTLWEHWSGKRGSLNHHMRSAVGAWMFRALTGLSWQGLGSGEQCADSQGTGREDIVGEGAGWARLVFRPRLTEKAPVVKAWHSTPYGRLEISIDRGKVRIELPEGISASLYWKEEKYELKGTWEKRLQ